MVQGSSVTTSVRPSSRHWPADRAAALIATISACAVGSPSASRRLRPRAITAPEASRTTAPTGTSPVSGAARASSSAARMAGSNEAWYPVGNGQAPRATSSARSIAGPKPSRTAIDSTASST